MGTTTAPQDTGVVSLTNIAAAQVLRYGIDVIEPICMEKKGDEGSEIDPRNTIKCQ